VPASVPKTTSSIPQISVAHDIIAIKNAASLVAAHFDGDALWNAGTDHVPDSRPSEVVRDAPWATGRLSSPPPRLVEPALRNPPPGQLPKDTGLRELTMEEHMLDDLVLRSLDLIGRRPLLLQELQELGRQIEDPPLPDLCGPRIKSDLPYSEIDLPPLNGQDLTIDSPAGDVRERHGRPHALGQVRQHSFVLLWLEETNADVLFAKHGEVGLVMQFSRLDRQAEHALEHGQLTVDLTGRSRPTSFG
jgi:hypothetical protein